jgi:flavin-dependent dehydrogenase
LIIGGGPAGAAAANICASSGLSVIVMELSPFPRFKPGETLHPGAESIFKQLGVWSQLMALSPIRHQGIWKLSNRSCEFNPYGQDENGEWCGFQFLRCELDTILLNQAASAGASVLQPCRAMDISREQDGSFTVESTMGDFRAPWVIDATGHTQLLARKLDLPILRYSKLLTARYGHSEYDESEICEPTFLIANSGWGWKSVIKKPALISWTTLGELTTKEQEALFGKSCRLPQTGCADVTWRSVTNSVGPGYFITGDAAVVLDPSSSHGVLKAMMSGIFAGKLISAVTTGHISPSAAASEYRRWLSSWVQQDIQRLTEIFPEHALADFEGGAK